MISEDEVRVIAVGTRFVVRGNADIADAAGAGQPAAGTADDRVHHPGLRIVVVLLRQVRAGLAGRHGRIDGRDVDVVGGVFFGDAIEDVPDGDQFGPVECGGVAVAGIGRRRTRHVAERVPPIAAEIESSEIEIDGERAARQAVVDGHRRMNVSPAAEAARIAESTIARQGDGRNWWRAVGIEVQQQKRNRAQGRSKFRALIEKAFAFLPWGPIVDLHQDTVN